MSEVLTNPPVSPSMYQRFVASTQIELGADWKSQYADWIRSESMEFLGQHGPGALLVMPDSFELDNNRVTRLFPEIKERMLDELGDMLWFGFGTAEYLSIDATEACRQSLVSSGIEIEPIDDFDKLTLVAIQHADRISVTNKKSTIMPDADDATRTTNLKENPFYVLQRTVGRLCRALDQGENESYIPTMSDLEEIPDIKQAIGDYIFTLTYIASVHLNSNIQEVAIANIHKLQDRQLHGKK